MKTVLIAGFCQAILVLARLPAQTYVQVAELNPTEPIGSRITSTVTQAKLSRKLFGHIADKVTYIDWTANPQTVYQFASDDVWNRVLFGKKDVYIKAFSQVATGTSLLGPAGIDYADQVSSALPLFIADRANERVVVATFNKYNHTLTTQFYTNADPDLVGVADVAYEHGPGYSSGTHYFYAVSVIGRISWWKIWDLEPSGNKLWSYGTAGSGTGQFRSPKGICVGHTLGPNGSSEYTDDFYVADGGNGRLVWLRNESTGPTWMGAVSLPNDGKPLSCTVDHFGNVTVADSLNSKLVKYTWNLIYLDSYGSYGTGATNNNTFAHPHAVDVPFGPKADPTFGWLWFGDGRVITAEDWGTQSGAREHFFGIDGSITAQPTSPQFSYFFTDHGSQNVTVLDGGGSTIRTLLNDALSPPGSRTISWDGYTDQGTLATTGSYRFKVLASSAYACSGQPCYTKSLTTSWFSFQGDPGPPQVSISGPSVLMENEEGGWIAVVSGGTAPYSYQWWVDGTSAGSSESTTGGPWLGGSYHIIDLTVTDALGRTGSSWLGVQVNCPQMCQ
jgi:hypothetical protein